MITKNFEQWLAEEVEDTFDIERKESLAILDKWLENTPEMPLEPRTEMLRKLLLQNVDAWNEDELKMMFIAPYLLEINFNNLPHYKVFTQRMAKISHEKAETQGRIEWMIATGRQIPKIPFFFLQEYKPEKSSGNDPLGQLLVAMVFAQQKNENDEVLYGSYVLGRFWFFVVLEQGKYAVSRAYDATQTDDLSAMTIILKRAKNHIHQRLNLPEIVNAK